MKQTAEWQDCPGLADRFEHSMRDHCLNCAPWWERFPVCPTDKTPLTFRGFCKSCRKYYEVKRKYYEVKR